MRTALKIFTILHLVWAGLIIFTSPGDIDILIGGAMFAVAPILTLVYLGQEKK